MTDADKIKLAKDLKELKVTVAVAPGTTTPVIPPTISGIAYDATGAELKRFNNQNELNDFLPTLCTEHATNLPGLSITGIMKYTDWPAFDQVFMFDNKKNKIAVKKKVNVNTSMAALVGDTKEVLVEIKNDKAHFTVKRVSGGADFPIDKLDEINKYLKALCATRGKTVMELVNVTLKSADWSGFFDKYVPEKDSIKEKTMVDADTAKKEKAVNDTDHVKFEFNNDKVEISLVKKDGSSEKFNDLDTFNEFLEFACNMKGKTAKELDDDGFFKTNDKTKFYGGVYEFDGNKIVEKSKKKKKAKTKNTSNKTSSGKLKKFGKGIAYVLTAGTLVLLGWGSCQLFGNKILHGGTNGRKVLEENGMNPEDATVDFGNVKYDPEADVIRNAHAQEFDLIGAHNLNNPDAVSAFMDQIKYYTENPDGHSLAAVAAPDDKSTIEVIDGLLCEGSTNSIQQVEGYVVDGDTELVLNGVVHKVVAFNNLHPLDRGIPVLALSCRLNQCTRPDVIFEGGTGGKDDSGKYVDFITAVNDKIVSLGGARTH